MTTTEEQSIEDVRVAPIEHPKVTKRIVSRWFFDGKGYATAHAAYRAKAKAELKRELWPFVEGFMEIWQQDGATPFNGDLFHEAWRQAYEFKFGARPMYGDNPPLHSPVYHYIDRRARELRREDESNV